MAQEKITQETNDQQKGDKQKVAEASCADEHGGRTVRQQARDRGNAIIRAHFANVISGLLGDQERMPEDGLHNSEGSNDYDENHIYEEKMTQLLFGIEQGIAYKQQGNIVKKEFQAQNPVNQVRRGRIKDLHHSKPDKQKDRQEKRGPERRDLFSPIRQKKSEIDNESQDVLGEIDRHVVAQVFSCKIFEQEPSQEEIEAVAPTIQHGDYEGGSDEEQRDVRKAGHIAGYDVIRSFIDGYNKQGHETQERERPAELISGHRSRHKIHDTASEKRKRSSIMEVRASNLLRKHPPLSGAS